MVPKTEDSEAPRQGVTFKALARIRAGLRTVRAEVTSIIKPRRKIQSKDDISRFPVEIVLDGGSFLNWRTESDVESLEICSLEGTDELHITHPSGDLGPKHGIFDISTLENRIYAVSARTHNGPERIRVLDLGKQDTTRNIGRVGGVVWELKCDEEGSVVLVANNPYEQEPAVLALESALGVVVVTVGPVDNVDWRVELRERKGSRRIVGARAADSEPGQVKAFFSSEQWEHATLAGDGEISRWNAFVVDGGETPRSHRLKWGGSDIADVRTAQRFRRSFARDGEGCTTRVRPYWTADQYLAVELANSGIKEGNRS